MAARLVTVERSNGKWGWELIGDNGSDIIASDANQFYEDEDEALKMGTKVTSGHYKDAQKTIRRLPKKP